MICEYCNKEHDGLYGSGRFCSKECARGFSTKGKRQEINRKVSEKLTKRIKKYCKICKKKLSHNNKKGICKFCSSKFCPRCGVELNEETAYKKTDGKLQAYCKKCFNKYCSNRWKNKKIKAISIKGGKCIICGYNKYYGALEFHHVNGYKEYEWRKLRLFSWEKILKELSKCVLLCSNCHREVHAGVEQLDGSAVF